MDYASLITPDGKLDLSESMNGMFHHRELSSFILLKKPVIKHLDLSGCFSQKDEELKEFITCLYYDPHLVHLSLSCNSLSDICMSWISTLLIVNRSLTTLDLRFNNFHRDGMRALAKAFKHNTTLTTLLLTNNRIGDEGAKELATSFKTLKELRLDNCGITKVGIESLSSNSLTTLRLDDNDVGGGVTTLLSNCINLIYLNLRQCNLNRDDIDTITQNHSLRELDLSINHIGSPVSIYVASWLKKNTTLTSLGIMMNGIGEDGAKSFSSALEVNSTLKQLYIGSNKLGGAGVNTLLRSLEKNKGLKCIGLGSTDNGDAPIDFQPLKSNYALEELGLDGVKVGDDGILELIEIVKSNFTLTKVRLTSISRERFIELNFIPNIYEIHLKKRGITNVENVAILESLLERNKRYHVSLRSMYKRSKVVHRSFKSVFSYYVRQLLLFDWLVFDETQNIRLSNFFLKGVSTSISKRDALLALNIKFESS